jgi:hypothetical protein
LLYRGLEETLLGGAQICHFVLVVQRHEPDLAVRNEIVVDDPQAATFPFASPAIRPAELSESASSSDDVTCLGVASQVKLELPVAVVAQVLREKLREQQASMNSTKANPTQLAYTRQALRDCLLCRAAGDGSPARGSYPNQHNSAAIRGNPLEKALQSYPSLMRVGRPMHPDRELT